MSGYAVLARGDWPAAAISARRVPSSFHLEPYQATEVERVWTAACARPGVNLFDGRLARLEGWKAGPAHLDLAFSEVGYQAFLGSNATHPEWATDGDRRPLADPLGTSAAILSADGRLVLGVRSPRVALYPGHVHPFGGTLDPEACTDPCAEMRRELAEELGLGSDDIADLRAVALVEDLALRQPELVFLARITLSLDDLGRRLDPEEHLALWSMPVGGSPPSSDDPPLTAVARAVIEVSSYRTTL